MKKLLIVGSIFFFSACYVQNNPSHKTIVRVLTYNIHHANPPSEDKSIIKLDAIAKVIRNSKADIVAIQELDSVTIRSGKVFQLQELAKLLHMYYYFGKAISFEGGAYGVGILSKYKLTDTTTTSLPKLESIRSEDRVLAMAKVHLPNKKYIWFGSTHLDVNNEKNRIMQIEKILETVQHKTPIIIAGDFNAVSNSASVSKLKTFFTDASNRHEPTIPNIKPNRKIDFIFYSNKNTFSLVNEKVMTEATYESDHLPYWADLEIK
ncbi:endonuclease/exonuclease/phosphatase family protein [Haoranjiania flava]|uniref:Endonuclease/exonuclease/phosphatase family protein n=1 Tax=Haoranjiania flava TaxID=1856322 RepID=A0AAE3ILG7_9BACT|nr:endonuclease/exonuclease/phosphatase family protein [Haoranjiania flava]MCU7693859.1 endonuclease/exonuclease/phosphatase family protein [Haoranjiania flava]